MITPLEKVIEMCGSQTALAIKINRPQATVTAWVNRFNFRVGAEFVIDVSGAADWQVTPHDLRPDLYPHPQDGLPNELRCQCNEKTS